MQNLEKGMFDDITSRMTGQAAEKFQDFNFDKMYEDVGVSRKRMLDYIRDMSANPEMAKVRINFQHLHLRLTCP